MRPFRLLFHAAALAWWLRVYSWHCSDDALGLPGQEGFGWFFRYLTFYSYTLQTITIGVCTLDDLTRKWSSTAVPGPMSHLADTLACVSFGFANVVTIMFHAVEALTHGGVDAPEKPRPEWLDPSVHVLNTVYAWADLFIAEPRTFGQTAEVLSTLLAMVYTVLILLVRLINGKFPYPFLNKYPFVQGFLLTSVAAVSVLAISFRVGKGLNSVLQGLLGRKRLAKQPGTGAAGYTPARKKSFTEIGREVEDDLVAPPYHPHSEMASRRYKAA